MSYTKDDIARVAENIYLMRMKKEDFKKTPEDDWNDAIKLCDKWWKNERPNT